MLLLLIAIVSKLTLSYCASVDYGQAPLLLEYDEKSFIDSIYGELVESEESKKHKEILLREGVKQFKYPDTGYDVTQLESMSFQETVNFMQSIDTQQMMRRKSHEAYMKYQLKLKLPHPDDTSDITDDNPNLFGGIVTFARAPHFDCFNPINDDKTIDIAIVGSPFDTGTSFRPGARMSPEAIRSASRRLGLGLTPVRGNGPDSKLSKIDPYKSNFTIIDCGDVPMTPFDNRIALNQLYRGERSIHKHKSKKNSKKIPKIITLGGDHTITLMALKSAYEKYGEIAVLHFDSHIDTWDPNVLGGGISDYMSLNHGTFLHYAAEQGYLAKGSCSHVGLRAPYINANYDQDHDEAFCGFKKFSARDIDNFGIKELSKRLKAIVGDKPVYITVDIDVLDPSYAPGTGTMEIGGLLTRELLTLLDSLEGINLIGGDIVEVSPPYDSNSEITSLAATSVVDSLLGLMVVTEVEI